MKKQLVLLVAIMAVFASCIGPANDTTDATVSTDSFINADADSMATDSVAVIDSVATDTLK